MLVRYASPGGGTVEARDSAKRGCKTGMSEPQLNAFVPQTVIAVQLNSQEL